MLTYGVKSGLFTNPKPSGNITRTENVDSGVSHVYVAVMYLRRARIQYTRMNGSRAVATTSGSDADDTAPSVEYRAALTARERQILAVLATGATTDGAARCLRISPDEVRVHVQNVMRKLQARSKLEALLIALRAGLIRDPSA